MYRILLAATSALLLLISCTAAPYISGKKTSNYPDKLFLKEDTAKLIGLIDRTTEVKQEPINQISASAALSAAANKDHVIQKSTIIALIAQSDMACEKYMAGIVTATNTVSSGLNIASLGFSSAASISAPIRSANILSGLSTFAGGTEDSLRRTVLGGKSPLLIYKSVMALRKKERSRIMGLLLQTNGSYFLAATEITPYHHKCGATVGINALEEAVDNADAKAGSEGKEEAQIEIEALRGKPKSG